jgi:hypothetical protein
MNTSPRGIVSRSCFSLAVAAALFVSALTAQADDVLPAGEAAIETIEVSSTADAGPGTLRDAILRANSSVAPLSTRITFRLGNNAKICPLSPLPTISRPTHIDGTSEQLYAGKPIIVLDGSCMGTQQSPGLRVAAGSSTISALVIINFNGDGIILEGTDKNSVRGSYIGIGADGVTAAGNKENGIFINGSSSNTIGSESLNGGNVISGNGVRGEIKHGILIHDGGSNTIVGNKIGTNAVGSAAVPNSANGIFIHQSPANSIGGAGAPYRNIISGNGTNLPGNSDVGYGITVAGPLAGNHVIQGNYIGTDASGTKKIPNMRSGINLHNTAQNLIGGELTSQRNVVSGNNRHGINVEGSAPYCADPVFGNQGFSHHNKIIGNFVGTNAAGTAALGNGAHGISLYKTHFATVSNNTVAGNGFSASVDGVHDGISILGDPDGCPNYPGGYAPSAPDPLDYISIGNILTKNRIGLGVAGQKIPNARHGVRIQDSLNNRVGGDTSVERNVIKFNKGSGVYVGGKYEKSNIISPFNVIQENVGDL